MEPLRIAIRIMSDNITKVKLRTDRGICYRIRKAIAVPKIICIN